MRKWLHRLHDPTAAERWQKRPLAGHLEPGEQVKAAATAFTGILGHPIIGEMPFLWGSTRWEICVTDRRLLAVEDPSVPFLKKSRKVISLTPPEISQTSSAGDMAMGGVGEVFLYVTTVAGRRHRFKLMIYRGWTNTRGEGAELIQALEQLRQSTFTADP